MSDFKRFIFAVSRGDIPCLHSLVATTQKCDSSVRRILELIDLAVQQVYHPKSYAKIDFQRQFLFLKLGGRQAAELAQHSFGLPSPDATWQHIQSKSLIILAKTPTLSEMTENLKTSLRVDEKVNLTASESIGAQHARQDARGPRY